MSVARDDDKHDAAAKDLICSNALSHEPPRVQLFALRRHTGLFANLEHAIWVATHPGRLNLSIEPWLHYSGVAPSYTAGDIAKGSDCVHLHPHYDNGDDGYHGFFYGYLDFGTLILTLISRCAPFMAGLLFADIVDTLLLKAAFELLGTVGQVPQCISAHNCDTKTMLRSMAFLDLCIGSTRWSLLSSRKHCDSQSQIAAAVSRPDG